MVLTTAPSRVSLLILGAGWTSTFLIPLLQAQNISYAATSTNGRDGTIAFKFDPDAKQDELSKSLRTLPAADTVLITFPLKGPGVSARLVEAYNGSHSGAHGQFIQLGSTGIWQGAVEGKETWVTRHSPYDSKNPRAVAEDELLGLGGCVLNLSGLWGGERQPRNWVDRVAATKEQLKAKKSLHMVHGLDVARGIIGVHQNFFKAKGQRYMVTDLIVYDWYTLILGFSGQLDELNGNAEREAKQIKWVGELMEEEGVRALPRSMEVLGRCYDSREFWETIGVWPVRSRI